MGNFTSCLPSNPQSAKLIDVHGTLRRIKPPITAAEIMLLEQPGHLISPVVDDLRSNFRLSALRADEELSNGKLYFLIPAGRLNSFVTESELEMLRCCKDVNGGKRRRKSKFRRRKRAVAAVRRNPVAVAVWGIYRRVLVENGYVVLRFGNPFWIRYLKSRVYY